MPPAAQQQVQLLFAANERRGASAQRLEAALDRARAPIRPGAVYDSNAAILAAAVEEAGGCAKPLGIGPDDELVLSRLVGEGLATSDMVILSGGTSKGAGDLCYRAIASFNDPGIVVHGVALKPGKPLCAWRSPAANRS